MDRRRLLATSSETRVALYVAVWALAIALVEKV